MSQLEADPDGGPATSTSLNWLTNGNPVTTGQFIGSIGSHALIMKTNAAERMRVDANGIVTVNYPTGYAPRSRFQVLTQGSDHVAIQAFARFNSSWNYGIQSVVNDANTKALAVRNETLVTAGAPDGEDVFLVYGDGRMEAKRIRVHLSGWSDHVFREDYVLAPLDDVEAYICAYGHLPGMPSEGEMLQQGDDLGEMDARLLEKIEELTLHLIQQDKQLRALQAELVSLKGSQCAQDQKVVPSLDEEHCPRKTP